MIETGRVLQQRYRINKQIGQGGMGAVYVATDERFGSTVAIKETLCMDENFRKAIEREARLLNSLKHTALPRVSDHFLEDEGQFLVMEFIPGEDLSFILERDERPFPIGMVLNWADQLLDALDFLHSQEIPVIHRDIKPQNLKVTTRGQIILLDFGLAKGNPTDAGHQTAAKSIFGYSRNYASLEQIQGTGTDPRSDLYSLAATLYHLSTGVPPEDALTRAMSVLSQREDPLMPASAIRPEIPRGVAGVLQKALDLNAAARPNSAAEMRQMFRESERYAFMAEPATINAPASDPQIHAQQTKMMPDETRTGEVNQTSIKTEVLPQFLSQVTAVRSDTSGMGPQTSQESRPYVTAAPRKSKLGKVMAAGVFGLLLVCGLAAGGIYVADPSFFGFAPEVDKPGSQSSVPGDKSGSNAAATDSGSGTAKIEPAAAGGNGPGISAEPPRAVETDPAQPEPAKPDLSKNNKTAGTGKNATKSDDHGEPDFQIVDSDNSGGMVITKRGENGKVTTTRVGPNGRLPNGRRPPDEGDPFPPGLDMQKMTPQQKRRLQMILRNANRPPYPDK